MTAQMFSPLEFRNLTVKNRIFRSSISGRFDREDGAPTQTRVNWESKFAAGGVGAIITSYVPVLMEGRIILQGTPAEFLASDDPKVRAFLQRDRDSSHFAA